MRFIFEGRAFRTEQVSLLRPARRDAADVVDNAVTGEMNVVFCVRKHARHQTRMETITMERS